MMPLAPSSATILPATKPKIGFSIDSIVGTGKPDSDSEEEEKKLCHNYRSQPSSPECSYIESANNNHLLNLHQGISSFLKARKSSAHSGSDCSINSNGNSEPNSPLKVSTTTDEDDETTKEQDLRLPSLLQENSSPKETASPLPHHPTPQIHHPPPLALLRGPHFPYAPGILNFATLAAAQSHPQQQQHPLAWLHGQHHHPNGHPHQLPPGHPASSHPLYPWFLAKHGRFFPHHRFGAGPDLHGFLLQPFRKPKRIRTAFSPSQLLKLEHAFEKNHYVVGAERKQLANNLSLSETQVKVWFQNRRTKHKRIEQEETSTTSSSKSSHNHGSHSSNNNGSSVTAATAASADTTTKLRYSSSGIRSEDEEEITEDEEDEEIVMDDYDDDDDPTISTDGNSDINRQHLEMLRQHHEQLLSSQSHNIHPENGLTMIRSHLLSSAQLNNNNLNKINVSSSSGSNLSINKAFNSSSTAFLNHNHRQPQQIHH